MLQSVIATVNQHGLQRLRLEDDVTYDSIRAVHPGCSVWAVLDSRDLMQVQRALIASQPATALRLLTDSAISIGSLSA